MAQAGDVLDASALGVQVEIRATGADTGGEYIEFDVVGRPCGLIAQPHVHTEQTESFEVIEGSMELTIRGRKHLLSAGDTMDVPPGAPHTQRAGPGGPGRVRVRTSPAGTTEQFLERLAEMSANGGFIRGGWPKPVAAARFIMDFGDTGHAASPPLRVQKALARTILRAASREYVFVDEWDVAAPPEAVFDALADARSYPEWWRPVYIDVDADGQAELGKVSRQHFKGRLPYHLHTSSRIVRLEPPRVVAAEVDGDLRGYGEWTLTPTERGTHVRFDWRVYADRRLLRVLTPLLRPAFRWNHNWAIARAMEGLEPYARSRAAREGERAAA
jgi:quercetin dioxygenase-like cupin family protein/uncharacterized protein YndB with AHSA1/START domain